MLSILKKATESLRKSGRPNLFVQYDVVEDLSAWEIVNAPLSNDEDRFSLDGDEPEAKLKEEKEKDEDAREPRDLAPPDDVVFMKSLPVSPPVTFHADLTRHHVDDDDDDDGDDDVYDEDEDGAYDDDDLVKWKQKRFGKGRMKMGKRGVRKVKNSKLPYYYYNRP